MFIQTEDTPNPATVKFLPGRPVLQSGQPIDLRSPDEAQISPLAQQIFALGQIGGVFLGTDFISVTKTNDVDWHMLKTRILATIMDFYMSGLPVIHDNADLSSSRAAEKDPDLYSEIEKQIVEILDLRVRPAVAQDGGDIVFDRFEDGVVYLHMRGACAGCPSSTATLKTGIENMLKHFVPEVEEVQAA